MRVANSSPRWLRASLVACVALIWTLWAYSKPPYSTQHAHALGGIPSFYDSLFASHAINNTVVIVPVNRGMLHLARNLLCSLRKTHFDSTKIIFWALDQHAEYLLSRDAHATYRDPRLFATDANENAKGTTAAYRRMMNERPKFFINILSSGYNLLMLDADTVFWQSPLSIVPALGEDVDVVYSTDARDFFQKQNAFRDPRRRGSYVPPICNGIFWMKSSPKTIALWTEMLDIFHAPAPLGWWERINFQDDQRGMDVLLNARRAEIVEPFPDGVTSDMIRQGHRSVASPKVRLLDQTQVVNGHLLLYHWDEYESNLAQLKKAGKERIAAHFNWDTKKISKEDGATRYGMQFVSEKGECIL